MPTDTYDVIVIGAGQGGGPIATAFAQDGRKTALIEREYPGGTCVNWGCTPTKTMIASGRVAYLARRADDYGVNIGDVSTNMNVVRERTREIVRQFREGSASRIEQTAGLAYVEGEAVFTGVKTIDVSLKAGSNRTMSADLFVINVGERSRTLDIPVSDEVTLHDSRSILDIDEVPEHLAVIGSGSIALEFGQLFRRLGADVTIINRGSRILSKEDDDIAQAVSDILREDGISIKVDSSPTQITREGRDILIGLSGRDGELEPIRASHVLVATGRVPNTDTLQVERTGLEVDDKGYIPTNDRLETNVSGIYAIGDVRPGPKFTHISYDDYRILKSNLIDGANRTLDDRILAATTFIDPQLGRVGPTERELREQGVPYLIAKLPMDRVARALETDESRGLMKVLVHAESRHILSAAILGIEGGEIASMIQIAMMGDLPYTALRDGVFAHPTLAESLNNLFGELQEPAG